MQAQGTANTARRVRAALFLAAVVVLGTVVAPAWGARSPSFVGAVLSCSSPPKLLSFDVYPSSAGYGVTTHVAMGFTVAFNAFGGTWFFHAVDSNGAVVNGSSVGQTADIRTERGLFSNPEALVGTAYSATITVTTPCGSTTASDSEVAALPPSAQPPTPTPPTQQPTRPPTPTPTPTPARPTPTAAPPNPRDYIGHIVQWDGDTKAQKTAWLVGADLRRRWIPDAGTYHCLKARGAPGPTVLPPTILDLLPDLSGTHATCGRHVARLTGVSRPFMVPWLPSRSRRPWQGPRSPSLTIAAENPMPLAATFTVRPLGGASASAKHGDPYSRLGLIAPGKTLYFTAQLPSTSTGRVEFVFSITDTKALVANLIAPGVGLARLNQLLAAVQRGPGAVLLWELKRRIENVLTSRRASILVVREVSAAMIRFGANRKNRKWLLANLGRNLYTAAARAAWAAKIARAAGAYAGLARAGVGASETVHLSARRIAN